MCIQAHAAIDAAFLTEQVIRQYLEPVVQGEQLPELKLEDDCLLLAKYFSAIYKNLHRVDVVCDQVVA